MINNNTKDPSLTSGLYLYLYLINPIRLQSQPYFLQIITSGFTKLTPLKMKLKFVQNGFIVFVLGFVQSGLTLEPTTKTGRQMMLLREPMDLKFLQQASRVPRVFSHPKVYRCDDQGKDLVVNFVNLNYPDNDLDGSECKFRMIITNPQVCQVRVDFVDTEMQLPIGGECISQRLEIQGSIWPTGLPPLCGKQNDQHFYLHLEQWVSNSTFIDFKVTTVVGGVAYRFGVWLTQIDCSSFNVLKAPDGCTQYFLGESGLMKSFNYEGSHYLSGQNYKICIRPAQGVCGIRYETKAGEFGIRKSIPAATTNAGKDVHLRSGGGSSICSMDYIMIPEGKTASESNRNGRIFFKRRQPASVPTLAPVPAPAPPPPPPPARIVQRLPPVIYDRFCGGRFSPITGDIENKPIFARIHSNLITLHVRTSGSIEAKNLRNSSRDKMFLGYRITYQQVRNCNKNETDLVLKFKLSNLFQNLHGGGIHRPILNTIFRDEVIVDESGSLTLMASILDTPDVNTSLLHRFGNTSDKGHGDDSDSLWDYLDDSWEYNGTGAYDHLYDF